MKDCVMMKDGKMMKKNSEIISPNLLSDKQ